MSTTPLSDDRVRALRARTDELLPQVLDDLRALTRIPSVSLGTFDQRHVEQSAAAVADLLRAEGMQVQVLREGGAPAVVGRIPAPEGAPTVLLYAHHDVQPPGDDADWTSPPFEPTEREGRLYGRGAADDKAGVMAHVAALRAHGGRPPVGVTVFVEGEEEAGSESLPTILERHRELLDCDALVLADSTNWAVGTPALTTTLRGMFRAVLTVRTLDHAVHSGIYGGPVPDALMVLTRLLAGLHDERGQVAVAGLGGAAAGAGQHERPDDADYPAYDPARLREEAGMLEGVELVGTGPLLARQWTGPSITTIGIDAPAVDRSSNTLVPSARAKVSVRIGPDQDPREAYQRLVEHLRASTPWGAHLDVALDDEGAGFRADVSGPVHDEARAAFTQAWDGTEPVEMGIGGSIPFVAAFAEQLPEAAVLITGVEDPDSRAHGADESLHLGEFARVCLAEALLLERLGRLPRG